jgi:molecular chaperone Hsp33
MEYHYISDTASIDFIQPFQIESSGIRGRFLRLSPVINKILSQQAYPEPVAKTLAEFLILTATLASTIKYEGIFTLQAKGSGGIKLMMADVTSKGEIRGYAQYDSQQISEMMRHEDTEYTVPLLFKDGFLAFTVDQGEYMERYQSIVSLTKDTLTECVLDYFSQSDQLNTYLKVSVGRAGGAYSSWLAAAILIQALPVDSKDEDQKALAQDQWEKSEIFVRSCKQEELLSQSLSASEIIFRLFHEDGVRLYDATYLTSKCRCSREKIVNILRSFGENEIVNLEQEGMVTADCEFCGAHYKIPLKELLHKH